MRANNFIDMTGKRFDRLQVISLARIGKDNHGRHRSIFHHMSDKEVIERMTAYEDYMKEHHVDSLPRRIAL